MGRRQGIAMTYSFLDRVAQDAQQRHINTYVNDMKREANEAGKKFGKCREFPDPRGKGFERKNKRGFKAKNLAEAAQPPAVRALPKLVNHHQHKIREKDKYLDQWGPLGW